MYYVIYSMAGGIDAFNDAFYFEGNQVLLKSGVDKSKLNSGQLLIFDMVQSPANFLFYAGTKGEAAARELVDGAARGNGNLTAIGRDRADKFECRGISSYCGFLVQTRGRPGQQDPPPPYFAAIGLNENTVITENSQPVEPVSFYIHESAENLEYHRKVSLFDPYPYEYYPAHWAAKDREWMIRLDLGSIKGGFAGLPIIIGIPSSGNK
jgi:hypothetical protein